MTETYEFLPFILFTFITETAVTSDCLRVLSLQILFMQYRFALNTTFISTTNSYINFWCIFAMICKDIEFKITQSVPNYFYRNDILIIRTVRVILQSRFVHFWRYNPRWARASTCTRFLDHTERRNRFGRTPLDEWSVHRRDFYLTTHNTHNRQTSMPLVVYEPTISAGERPKTYVLDRAATGAGLPRIRHQFQ
jgi:hypothetical protein